MCARAVIWLCRRPTVANLAFGKKRIYVPRPGWCHACFLAARVSRLYFKYRRFCVLQLISFLGYFFDQLHTVSNRYGALLLRGNGTHLLLLPLAPYLLVVILTTMA